MRSTSAQTPIRELQPVPRYTLTRKEAAASLGTSINHFERRVQPELNVVLSGQLVLIPITEVERWVQPVPSPPTDSAADEPRTRWECSSCASWPLPSAKTRLAETGPPGAMWGDIMRAPEALVGLRWGPTA